MSETQKGSETLKPSPSTKNELDCFITKNHNLIYSFLKRRNLTIDDYYDIAAIGLVKAARTFNPEQGSKFSTYAYFIMWNEVKHQWRKETMQKREGEKYLFHYNTSRKINDDKEINDGLNCISDIRCDVENETIIKIVLENFLDKIKNEKEKKILYKFIAGYKQIEIAKEFNTTQSNISRIINKLLKQLKKELDIK